MDAYSNKMNTKTVQMSLILLIHQCNNELYKQWQDG